MQLDIPLLIPPLDQAAMDAARARQDTLTKPRGSLGRLEALSIQLAGISGCSQPRGALTIVMRKKWDT